MENALKRKSNLVACVLILIVVCLGIVFADDVVVKEGDLDVNNLDASGDITVAGKVGIGTETPSRELDIVGDMSITGDVVGDLSVTGDATISGTGTFGKIETTPRYFEIQNTFSDPQTWWNEMYFLGSKNKDMWFGFFADGEDGWWGPAFGIDLKPSTPQGNGTVTIEAFYGDGILCFRNNDLDIQSTKKLMFNDEKLTINHDGTNARMDYGTDISYPLLLSGHVSAETFIARKTVYDKSKGSALDWIKDSSDYKGVDGQTKYSEFYGYTTYYVTDYSRPEVEFYDEIVRKKSGRTTVQKSRTIYPYKKIEEATSLDEEVTVLRQGIYDLKQENQMLKDELQMLKNELCLKDPSYSWCK